MRTVQEGNYSEKTAQSRVTIKHADFHALHVDFILERNVAITLDVPS